MDHGKRVFSIEKALVPEPCEELIAIRCSEDGLHSIFRTYCGNVLGDRKEKEVMVAQDDDSPIAKVLDIAKDVQRIRTTVDQIADKPQSVGAWIEPDQFKKALQGLVASLHIADRVGSHVG